MEYSKVRKLSTGKGVKLKKIGHHKRGLHAISFVLLVIGGLNWLLLALFHWEVGVLFGGMASVGAKVVYILVGLSAIYEVLGHGHRCKECRGEMADKDMHNPSMPA